MKDDIWEKVEQIFHTALDLPVEDRNSYLQRACAGNAVLFSEVESLLSSFEQNADFLNQPVFELGLEAINHSQPEKNLSGSTIAYYQLQGKIGAGGMGEVYKALDTRLKRCVALKFLSESLKNDNAAKRRLVKEARAVAMLEHPNICTVHGIEQSDDYHFIVMQYIKGKTLAEYIAEQVVTVEKFEPLARQILTAIDFAHSHGVIHRDLKPGNIMLTDDEQIKVLDFGLAKIAPRKQSFGRDTLDERSQFSRNGLIIGTVSYMSPEQLRGEKLDYQSDIFSVGIILYELLTGQNPFKRDSQAETIAAILSNEPPALKKLSAEIPQNLTNLVEKCLQKEKEKRFHSAAEILVELDKADSANPTKTAAKRRQRFFLKAAFVAVILFAVLALVFFYSRNLPQRTLAVLPISFDSPQPEKEYIADGLTQSIIDKLSNLSGLKVKNESTVRGYKGKPVEAQTAGKELNVDAVYTGLITRRGDSLILTTRLVRTSDGGVIDTDSKEIDEANLIELQENISARIVNKINTKLSVEDETKLIKKDTENPQAKLAYIRGRYYLERQEGEDLENAKHYFIEATRADPAYAKAWTGLADTYSLISVPGHKGSILPAEALKLAKAAAKQAIDIDDSLCEPYVSMGMIKLKYDWEWDAAENYLRAAIARNPEFPQAHLQLSNLLIIKRAYAESTEEAKKAKEIAPFSVLPDLSLARTYYFERNYDQMDKVLSESSKNFSNHKRLNYFRGLRYLALGRLTEAIEIFEKIYQEDKIYGAAPLGLAYGRMGRKDEARKILAVIEELSKKDGEDYIPSQERSIIYLGIGETDKVFEYLKKACDEKFPAFPFVITDPIFDEIRADARFADLRKYANL